MPKMLVHLRSFITVVEEGSLHRAAERLHLSQSTLSRQMQALEAELGGQLLERTSSIRRASDELWARAGREGAAHCSPAMKPRLLKCDGFCGARASNCASVTSALPLTTI